MAGKKDKRMSVFHPAFRGLDAGSGSSSSSSSNTNTNTNANAKKNQARKDDEDSKLKAQRDKAEHLQRKTPKITEQKLSADAKRTSVYHAPTFGLGKLLGRSPKASKSPEQRQFQSFKAPPMPPLPPQQPPPSRGNPPHQHAPASRDGQPGPAAHPNGAFWKGKQVAQGSYKNEVGASGRNVPGDLAPVAEGNRPPPSQRNQASEMPQKHDVSNAFRAGGGSNGQGFQVSAVVPANGANARVDRKIDQRRQDQFMGSSSEHAQKRGMPPPLQNRKIISVDDNELLANAPIRKPGGFKPDAIDPHTQQATPANNPRPAPPGRHFWNSKPVDSAAVGRPPAQENEPRREAHGAAGGAFSRGQPPLAPRSAASQPSRTPVGLEDGAKSSKTTQDIRRGPSGRPQDEILHSGSSKQVSTDGKAPRPNHSAFDRAPHEQSLADQSAGPGKEKAGRWNPLRHFGSRQELPQLAGQPQGQKSLGEDRLRDADSSTAVPPAGATPARAGATGAPAAISTTSGKSEPPTAQEHAATPSLARGFACAPGRPVKTKTPGMVGQQGLQTEPVVATPFQREDRGKGPAVAKAPETSKSQRDFLGQTALGIHGRKEAPRPTLNASHPLPSRSQNEQDLRNAPLSSHPPTAGNPQRDWTSPGFEEPSTSKSIGATKAPTPPNATRQHAPAPQNPAPSEPASTGAAPNGLLKSLRSKFNGTKHAETLAPLQTSNLSEPPKAGTLPHMATKAADGASRFPHSPDDVGKPYADIAFKSGAGPVEHGVDGKRKVLPAGGKQALAPLSNRVEASRDGKTGPAALQPAMNGRKTLAAGTPSVETWINDIDTSRSAKPAPFSFEQGLGVRRKMPGDGMPPLAAPSKGKEASRDAKTGPFAPEPTGEAGRRAPPVAEVPSMTPWNGNTKTVRDLNAGAVTPEPASAKKGKSPAAVAVFPPSSSAAKPRGGPSLGDFASSQRPAFTSSDTTTSLRPSQPPPTLTLFPESMPQVMTGISPTSTTAATTTRKLGGTAKQGEEKPQRLAAADSDPSAEPVGVSIRSTTSAVRKALGKKKQTEEQNSVPSEETMPASTLADRSTPALESAGSRAQRQDLRPLEQPRSMAPENKFPLADKKLSGQSSHEQPALTSDEPLKPASAASQWPRPPASVGKKDASSSSVTLARSNASSLADQTARVPESSSVPTTEFTPQAGLLGRRTVKKEKTPRRKLPLDLAPVAAPDIPLDAKPDLHGSTPVPDAAMCDPGHKASANSVQLAPAGAVVSTSPPTKSEFKGLGETLPAARSTFVGSSGDAPPRDLPSLPLPAHQSADRQVSAEKRAANPVMDTHPPPPASSLPVEAAPKQHATPDHHPPPSTTTSNRPPPPPPTTTTTSSSSSSSKRTAPEPPSLSSIASATTTSPQLSEAAFFAKMRHSVLFQQGDGEPAADNLDDRHPVTPAATRRKNNRHVSISGLPPPSGPVPPVPTGRHNDARDLHLSSRAVDRGKALPEGPVLHPTQSDMVSMSKTDVPVRQSSFRRAPTNTTETNLTGASSSHVPAAGPTVPGQDGHRVGTAKLGQEPTQPSPNNKDSVRHLPSDGPPGSHEEVRIANLPPPAPADSTFGKFFGGLFKPKAADNLASSLSKTTTAGPDKLRPVDDSVNGLARQGMAKDLDASSVASDTVGSGPNRHKSSGMSALPLFDSADAKTVLAKDATDPKVAPSVWPDATMLGGESSTGLRGKSKPLASPESKSILADASVLGTQKNSFFDNTNGTKIDPFEPAESRSSIEGDSKHDGSRKPTDSPAPLFPAPKPGSRLNGTSDKATGDFRVGGQASTSKDAGATPSRDAISAFSATSPILSPLSRIVGGAFSPSGPKDASRAWSPSLADGHAVVVDVSSRDQNYSEGFSGEAKTLPGLDRTAYGDKKSGALGDAVKSSSHDRFGLAHGEPFAACPAVETGVQGSSPLASKQQPRGSDPAVANEFQERSEFPFATKQGGPGALGYDQTRPLSAVDNDRLPRDQMAHKDIDAHIAGPHNRALVADAQDRTVLLYSHDQAIKRAPGSPSADFGQAQAQRGRPDEKAEPHGPNALGIGNWDNTSTLRDGSRSRDNRPGRQQSPHERDDILENTYPREGAGHMTSPRKMDDDLANDIVSMYDGTEYVAPNHSSTGEIPATANKQPNSGYLDGSPRGVKSSSGSCRLSVASTEAVDLEGAGSSNARKHTREAGLARWSTDGTPTMGDADQAPPKILGVVVMMSDGAEVERQDAEMADTTPLKMNTDEKADRMGTETTGPTPVKNDGVKDKIRNLFKSKTGTTEADGDARGYDDDTPQPLSSTPSDHDGKHIVSPTLEIDEHLREINGVSDSTNARRSAFSPGMMPSPLRGTGRGDVRDRRSSSSLSGARDSVEFSPAMSGSRPEDAGVPRDNSSRHVESTGSSRGLHGLDSVLSSPRDAGDMYTPRENLSSQHWDHVDAAKTIPTPRKEFFSPPDGGQRESGGFRSPDFGDNQRSQQPSHQRDDSAVAFSPDARDDADHTATARPTLRSPSEAGFSDPSPHERQDRGDVWADETSTRFSRNRDDYATTVASRPASVLSPSPFGRDTRRDTHASGSAWDEPPHVPSSPGKDEDRDDYGNTATSSRPTSFFPAESRFRPDQPARSTEGRDDSSDWDRRPGVGFQADTTTPDREHETGGAYGVSRPASFAAESGFRPASRRSVDGRGSYAWDGGAVGHKTEETAYSAASRPASVAVGPSGFQIESPRGMQGRDSAGDNDSVASHGPAFSDNGDAHYGASRPASVAAGSSFRPESRRSAQGGGDSWWEENRATSPGPVHDNRASYAESYNAAHSPARSADGVWGAEYNERSGMSAEPSTYPLSEAYPAEEMPGKDDRDSWAPSGRQSSASTARQDYSPALSQAAPYTPAREEDVFSPARSDAASYGPARSEAHYSPSNEDSVYDNTRNSHSYAETPGGGFSSDNHQEVPGDLPAEGVYGDSGAFHNDRSDLGSRPGNSPRSGDFDNSASRLSVADTYNNVPDFNETSNDNASEMFFDDPASLEDTQRGSPVQSNAGVDQPADYQYQAAASPTFTNSRSGSALAHDRHSMASLNDFAQDDEPTETYEESLRSAATPAMTPGQEFPSDAESGRSAAASPLPMNASPAPTFPESGDDDYDAGAPFDPHDGGVPDTPRSAGSGAGDDYRAEDSFHDGGSVVEEAGPAAYDGDTRASVDDAGAVYSPLQAGSYLQQDDDAGELPYEQDDARSVAYEAADPGSLSPAPEMSYATENAGSYRPEPEDSFEPDVSGGYQGDNFQADDYQGGSIGGDEYQGDSFQGDDYQGGNIQDDDFRGDDFQGDDYPADGFPADDYPADAYPADDFPADDFPADDFPPVDDYPADDLPADDFQGDGFQGDSFQGDDLPADDYPADDFQGDGFQGDGFQGDDFQPADGFPADDFPTDNYPTDDFRGDAFPADNFQGDDYQGDDFQGDGGEYPTADDGDFPAGGEADDYLYGDDGEPPMSAGGDEMYSGDERGMSPVEGGDDFMDGQEQSPIDEGDMSAYDEEGVLDEGGFSDGGNDELGSQYEGSNGGNEEFGSQYEGSDRSIDGPDGGSQFDEEGSADGDNEDLGSQYEGSNGNEDLGSQYEGSDRGSDNLDDQEVGSELESGENEDFGSQYEGSDGGNESGQEMGSEHSGEDRELDEDDMEEDAGSEYGASSDQELADEGEPEDSELASSDVEDRELQDGPTSEMDGEDEEESGDRDMDDLYESDVGSIPASPALSDADREATSPGLGSDQGEAGLDEDAVFAESAWQQNEAHGDLENADPVRLSQLYSQDPGLYSFPATPTTPSGEFTVPAAGLDDQEEDAARIDPVRFSHIYQQDLDWEQALSNLREVDEDAISEEGDEDALDDAASQKDDNWNEEVSHGDLPMLDVDHDQMASIASPLSPRPLATPPPDSPYREHGQDVEQAEEPHKGNNNDNDNDTPPQNPLSPREQPTPPPEQAPPPRSPGESQYSSSSSGLPDPRGPQTFEEMDLSPRVMSPPGGADDEEVEEAMMLAPRYVGRKSIGERVSGWWGKSAGGSSSGQMQTPPMPPLPPAPYDSRYGEPASPA